MKKMKADPEYYHASPFLLLKKIPEVIALDFFDTTTSIDVAW